MATITLNMNKRCAECDKNGVMKNGLCLACNNKAMKSSAKMRSEIGKAVQYRWQKIVYGKG